MCRSIKPLRRAEGAPATDAEIRAAALQFVRKVSGYRQPSRANGAPFEAAVDEVTQATERLLHALHQPVPTRARGHAPEQVPAAGASGLG